MLFKRYISLRKSNKKLSIPERVKKAVEEYKKKASTYQRFFSEKIEHIPGYKVSLNEIYDEFKQYVDRDFKAKKGTFVTQMERLIGKPKSNGGNMYYVGFRIKGTSGEVIESDDE
jgi:hypothetical protein